MSKLIAERKTFEYRNNYYEIKHHSLFEKVSSYQHEFANRCYYIFPNLDQNVQLEEVERLCEIGEFHGGITYCRKIIEKSFDHPEDARWKQDHIFFKVGCDYNHASDMGKHYEDHDICRDAEKTIDKLIEAGILKE